MKSVSAAVLIVVAGLIAAAYALGRASAEPERVIVPDTVRVTPPELERQIEALEIERDGLRARLEGVYRTGPRTVVVTDTVYRELPAARCVVAARADGDGRVDVGRFDAVPSGWTGTIDRQVDLGRCDDGWSIGPRGYTCDPARLGHLTAVARLGLARDPAGIEPIGAVGLRWTPYYRATWAVEARATTDGRVEVVGEIGWRWW